jgi:hypothetical protein
MDYETWERESYLRNRQTEMELDARHRLERMESDYRRKMIVHNINTFQAGKLKATELVCSLIVIVGAAHILGLI